MRTIGIIMNGVTGRMGENQHLARSIVALRQQGGVLLANGERLMPDPILVGRNAQKLQQLAEKYHIERWSTDLHACLANPANEVYFDAQLTALRSDSVQAAIAAGKHVYCEKPVAPDLSTALALVRLARKSGIKHGVVQDKLFLPGMLKLKRVIESGFLGRILAVRGEFGYWIFEGDWQTAQRPSWNYQQERGGGIILDMFCHWRYILDQLFGEVQAVSSLGAIHIPERFNEVGERYTVTADDAAYATFELAGNVIAQINSSWNVRVYRDELVQFQVDGTLGSAVAGLHHCKVQSRVQTPRAVWNPDIPNTHDFRADWIEVPDNGSFENGFKAQWELFLRHVVCDEPFPWDLLAGAKGVQLAEAGLRSWHERCWQRLPALEQEVE